jgi:hypothetical protein
MSNARVIEFADETIGIAVEDQDGVVFFAATPAYGAVDGERFRTVRDAEKAVRRVASRRKSDPHNGRSELEWVLEWAPLL